MKKITCPRCWNKKMSCDHCNNSGRIYDTKLTENFTLGELTYSRTAREKGISNNPTRKQVECLREFTTKLLQPCRDEVGIIEVTSGFRSPELNAVLPGSAKDSAHMLGYAVDLQPSDATFNEVMRWFKNTNILFDQAILEYGRREDKNDDDWVHVGYKNSAGEQRRQLLMMKNGKYTKWTS